MRIRMVPIAALSSVLLVGGLAGCGSEAGQEAAEHSSDPVVAAAGKAAEDKTARIALTVTAEGRRESVTGAGFFDLVKGDDGFLSLQAPGPRGREAVDFMAVDGKAYQSESYQPGPDAAPTRWHELSQDPKEAAGKQAEPIDDFASQNPLKMLRLLESASEFDEHGTMQVQGATVARWTGTIDLAEIQDEQDKTAAKELRDAGLDKLPAEVGIDDQGRLVHVGFTIDVAKAAAASDEQLQPGAPKSVTFVLQLSDFGVEMQLDPPPADQVVDDSDASGAAQ
jgi:hypothetical protein